MVDAYLGNIWATRLSVFCRSTSSSSVLSLIRSSRLEEYCSNMRSMELMMLVFFPLVMLLNWVGNQRGPLHTHVKYGPEFLFVFNVTMHNNVVGCKVSTFVFSKVYTVVYCKIAAVLYCKV